MMTKSPYIHPSAFVEEGASVGDETRIWHCAHVRKGASLGKGCVVGKGAFIDADVHIGDYVKIQNNASIYKGVSLGDGVFVGPHACFTNDKLPRAINPDGMPRAVEDWAIAKTNVERGASIGANATIAAGVTLGEWCMVGAGAVVTRSVPAHALVVGNPARAVGVVAPSGEIVAREFRLGVYATSGGITFEVR
jgi:UDP-2-acetamido-3-amino-2,3-dideoxy-glucuronate N-acetyltransferase